MLSSVHVRRHRIFLGVGVFAAALFFGIVGADAQTTNIAGLGTGTIGFATDPTMNGTELDHAGSSTAINDNDPTTHVDTFPQSTNDYVGVTFSSPQNGVQNVGLTMAMFTDGGWFGPSNTSPGAGNSLAVADLSAPTLQITTDGVNWTNPSTTDNYVSAMTGASIGGGANPNPNNSPLGTFTLSTTANDILGIRLLGNGGGVANGTGFIGVSELYINAVPEPSTLALAALSAVAGMMATIRWRRRRV